MDFKPHLVGIKSAMPNFAHYLGVAFYMQEPSHSRVDKGINGHAPEANPRKQRNFFAFECSLIV